MEVISLTSDVLSDSAEPRRIIASAFWPVAPRRLPLWAGEAVVEQVLRQRSPICEAELFGTGARFAN